MSEILFVTWDGGGNVPPAVGIARELQRRGHGVRVLGHPSQAAAMAEAGLAFRPFATARPFASVEVNSLPRLIGLFTERAMGADVLAEAARSRTDVVVVDCLLLGPLRAVADAGLPYVSREHLSDGYLRRGWLRGPIGLVGRLKGLGPVAAWDGAARTLVTSPVELDPRSGSAPRNLLHTGPVLDVPEPHDLEAHDPAVLVSLSTYRYPGMTRALQNLLDATADLDARVVVTTGPAVDPADLRPSARHEVHRFVPHDELMPQMTLVVGHGGHATTMRALAHDLPLVVMPMHPLLDQPLVGRSVQEAGAGRVVAKKDKPAALTPVIAELLADGPHRAAAARLGASIRAARGARTAADAILATVTGAVSA